MQIALTLAAALALATPAAATEETVRFTVDEQTVVGTLSLPDGDPAPVIVLFHGRSRQRLRRHPGRARDGALRFHPVHLCRRLHRGAGLPGILCPRRDGVHRASRRRTGLPQGSAGHHPV